MLNPSNILLFTACIVLFISCAKEKNIYIPKDTDTFSVLESPNDSSSIDFYVLSDWGENSCGNQSEVARAMGILSIKEPSDFIVTCGDNFQSDGVNSIEDNKWQQLYEQMYNYPGLKVNWYAALGNHDYNSNPAAQIEYSKYNINWKMPSWYYTFKFHAKDSNSIRFVVLDTQGLLNEFSTIENYTDFTQIKQLAWLDSTLAINKEKWVIVIGHHTIYSSSFYHGNTAEMIELVDPILKKYNILLYISGHDHDFEHIKIPNQKLQYIITGTGSSVRDIAPSENTQYCISALGFTYIKVYPNLINLKFINSNDSCLYQTNIYN
jgi:predicted MPP superfamily phosphohydrolase